ncbi:CopG family transcriptional regulator [Stappia sp. MMSF_3263]|uniref:CopG family transcriptional regulator n=1 Tax=Stappia sp. MMSF_3263 TaxID=3046693 RepID=UPI00273DB5F3|nr:CopG family transcriptional regulator [Stappia sp. MMSF_3263]
MKLRHNIYLDKKTSDKLSALAGKPGDSKSSIIVQAIHHFARHRDAPFLSEALASRLDRLTRENARARRDLEVLTEALAFFVRLYLMFNAHTPVPDHATRALARERYRKFIDQVARQVATGVSSFTPEEGEEQGAPDAAAACGKEGAS